MKTDLLLFFREGTTAIQKMLFTCCSVNAAAESMWVALKPSFGRDLMFTNRILGHTQANVTRVHLTGAK